MTATLTDIWRFPIKSHGREQLQSCTLEVGKTLPWDRHWAVAHSESTADGASWAPCHNFSRVAKAPNLAAISCQFDAATNQMQVRHPEREDLVFDPDKDGARFIDWARDFIPQNRAQSARLVRSETNGFTDSDFPSVTLCNMASHRAVSQRVGRPLSIHRWRGNIWFDGAAPWEEFDWMDREVQVGEAVLRVLERTDRCLTTHANPDTGKRDADVLPALDSWGHRDFSVRAEVLAAGAVRVGDTVRRL